MRAHRVSAATSVVRYANPPAASAASPWLEDKKLNYDYTDVRTIAVVILHYHQQEKLDSLTELSPPCRYRDVYRCPRLPPEISLRISRTLIAKKQIRKKKKKKLGAKKKKKNPLFHEQGLYLFCYKTFPII